MITRTTSTHLVDLPACDASGAVVGSYSAGGFDARTPIRSHELDTAFAICREASRVYCYGIHMVVLSSLLSTLQLHWLIENRYAAFQWQATAQLLLLNSFYGNTVTRTSLRVTTTSTGTQCREERPSAHFSVLSVQT